MKCGMVDLSVKPNDVKYIDLDDYIYSVKNIKKDIKKRPYMDRICFFDDSLKWNGLLILDIDIKNIYNLQPFGCMKYGSPLHISTIKRHLHNELSNYPWYYGVCASTGGQGIHIITTHNIDKVDIIDALLCVSPIVLNKLSKYIDRKYLMRIYDVFNILIQQTFISYDPNMLITDKREGDMEEFIYETHMDDKYTQIIINRIFNKSKSFQNTIQRLRGVENYPDSYPWETVIDCFNKKASSLNLP